MRELCRWQNAIFRIGAVLMLVGVALNMVDRDVSFYLYSIGTLCFTSMQVTVGYAGSDVTVRRLRVQQLMACLMFVLAAVCMSMQVFSYGIARHGEWVVLLSIACVLELYTSLRLPAALSKAKNS